MRKTSKIIPLSLLILFSCKTQEEIQRDKIVDQLAVQIVENQKLAGNSTAKLQELEHQIAKMQGQVEETGHELQMSQSEKEEQLDSRLKVLEENHELMKSNVLELKTQLEANQKFIKEVLSKLSKITNASSNNDSSPYNTAMANYKKGQYTTARTQLESLLGNKDISGNRKARIIHNLGMIAYIQKRYDDALVYMSRLYTEYPKESYVKNGLLYLGRSFVKKGQKEQAKQTFNELISKYPKSSSAKNAKDELKKL
ncbi:MAG: tetratricopeptide repeat protein [Halobacteriovoraceae bacterium]|nr:tetratricopeptide repeat protein [Halobacteriovoraceae bacterium]